ncbi:MAG: hypothetical protein ACK5JC_00160 [Bacteroidota bacterium]
MKKISLFVLLFLQAGICVSQSDFYEALEIAAKKKQLKKEVQAILDYKEKKGSEEKVICDTTCQSLFRNFLLFLDSQLTNSISPFD